MPSVLDIHNLHVDFNTPEGTVHAVDGVSLRIDAGETVGLVGESGCGKSVTAMSILRLIPSPPGHITSGIIHFNGQDITQLPTPALQQIRGAAIGMVFQDPMTALSPLHKIGPQLIEAIRLHRPISRSEALLEAHEWLAKAGIQDPTRCLNEYPFRLSGGQQQRVMIASVLMTRPQLIIADEPTTALDVTIQAQVLELMRKAKGSETALLLITHNMGVVWQTCSRMAVMYAGEIVETGAVTDIFREPRHPYTQALLDAMPSNGRPHQPLPALPGSVPSPLAFPSGCRFHPRCPHATPECAVSHPALTPIGESAHATRCPLWLLKRPPSSHTTHTTRISFLSTPIAIPNALDTPTPPLLEAVNLQKKFPKKHAVRGVSLQLNPGETLAIVGESGCGKTTLARMLVGLETPSAGTLSLHGKPLPFHRPFNLRREIQMVFQDPYASLNPRLSVAEIITEGALAHHLISRKDQIATAQQWLQQVGLPPEAAFRYPHEFSGGQRQRISIARALALKPKIILCDEPVSALDVSVQAQILNLLASLQRDFHPAYLFITHDLGVVRRIAHRIAVMHDGLFVEEGPAQEILSHPQHPYTQTLLNAEPRLPLL